MNHTLLKFVLFSTVFLTSCENKDILKVNSPYKEGDILVFELDNNKYDTIKIIGFEIENYIIKKSNKSIKREKLLVEGYACSNEICNLYFLSAYPVSSGLNGIDINFLIYDKGKKSCMSFHSNFVPIKNNLDTFKIKNFNQNLDTNYFIKELQWTNNNGIISYKRMDSKHTYKVFKIN
jgi:hypothetical protein